MFQLFLRILSAMKLVPNIYDIDIIEKNTNKYLHVDTTANTHAISIYAPKYNKIKRD